MFFVALYRRQGQRLNLSLWPAIEYGVTGRHTYKSILMILFVDT